MKKHIYTMPDGDIELGDYPARRRKDFITVNWILTEICNLKCRYCFGPNSKTKSNVLKLPDGITKILSLFKKLQDVSQKNIYVNISGGEPSLEPRFTELCKCLTKNNIYIQPQTNFIADFKPFFDQVILSFVAWIDAGYHDQTEKDPNLNDKFMKNLDLANYHGIDVIVKYVADTKRIKNFKENYQILKNKLLENTLINIAPFISGYSFPRNYSSLEKDLLLEYMIIHKNSNVAFWNSGLNNNFSKMLCSAGKDVLYLDISGNLNRCLSQGGNIGGIHQKEIKLFSEYKACGQPACSCTQRALWFGIDPWNYISGIRKEDAFYCRFGPDPKIDLSY